MIRRYLWVPAVVSGIVVIFLLLLALPSRYTGTGDPVKAVPSDAALFVQGNGVRSVFTSVRADNPIWNELLALPSLERFDSLLLLLDSLAIRFPVIESFYKDQACVMAVFPTGREKAEFLLVTAVPDKSLRKNLEGLLQSLTDTLKVNKRPYEDTEIYQTTFRLHGHTARYHFAFSHGLFLLGSSPVLTERAIRHLMLGESLNESFSFRQVASTAGKNVDANLFINLGRLPSLLSVILSDEYRKKINEIPILGEWAELDLNVKEEAILFNGFAASNDSLPQLLNLFRGQNPQVRNIETVLPANTVWFASVGLSDIKLYWRELDQLLLTQGKERSIRQLLDRIGHETGKDIRALLQEVFNAEAAVAMTDTRNTGTNGNLFVVINTRSRQMTEEKIKAFLQSYGEKQNKNMATLIHQIRIDAETSFPVYEMPYGGIPALLLGGFFGGGEYRYLAMVDNFMVFANSRQALSGFVHQKILGRTLQNDLMYEDFSEYLSGRYFFHFFLNLPRAMEVLPMFLSARASLNLDKNRNMFQKLQGLAFQFSGEKKMVYNNLFLKYSPVYRELTSTVWESLLDTAVRMKPILVANHNTGDQEILVQDIRNNLYLLNATGRVLWKLPLKEPVMGEVYQIDYYGNRKLQYCFNTRHQLHLIDRNGNYVERYPVTLASPAANTLSLFDYDSDRNYRLFVAGEDRRIYVYSKEGNLVTGWNAQPTEHIVQQPVQHFRVGSTDYIVLKDQYRSYILDRRGNTRVTPGQQFDHSTNNIFHLDQPGSGQARLVTTDTQGRVYYIYFDGRVESTETGKFSQDHFFEYFDLNGNGRKEYIFLDRDKLEVYGADRTLLFSYTFEKAAEHAPNIYEFSGRDRKIGVVVPGQNRLYLFNNDGKLYKGFPLPGSSPFTIGKLRQSGSRFNLIVGGRDNFLLNYSVQ